MFRWSTIVLVFLAALLGTAGCIIIPIPYAHPSFIAAKDLATADELIITEVTIHEEHYAVPFPCYPFEESERAIRLIPTSNGQLATQSHFQCEWFNAFFGFGMFPLPLPGYVWKHDTICLKVYRRGYQTITIKNWDCSSHLTWQPAREWLERELAIDDLLYSKRENRHEMDIHLKEIETCCWFNNDNSDERIKQTKLALARVAHEYAELAAQLTQVPGTVEQQMRVNTKAQQLRWLTQCSSQKQLEDQGMKFEGSEKGTIARLAHGPIDAVQQATNLLTEAGLTYYLVGEASKRITVQSEITIYVPDTDRNRAIDALESIKNTLGKDFWVSDPVKVDAKQAQQWQSR